MLLPTAEFATFEFPANCSGVIEETMKLKDPLFSIADVRPADPLALRPRECAAALGISERLLCEWTSNQGLPHVRIRNTVLYPVDTTREWLRDRAVVHSDDTISGMSDNAE